MFEFLIPVSIFGFGGYFVYKLCELYGMRSERKTIIDRLESSDLVEYVKRMPIGVGGGNPKSAECESQKQTPARWTLRCALLIIGFGVGVVLGNFLALAMNFKSKQYVYNPTEQFEAVYLACVCICTGLGLLLSFIIETKMSKKE